MKLLGSSRGPYVQKVRLAIAEKGLACEHDQLAPSAPEIAAANPLAKIPTLLRDDGRAVYDSSVIIEYVDGLGSMPKLIPAEFEARVEVKRWEALGNGMMDAMVAISHENRLPVDQRRGPDFYARHQKKIDAGLATMERDLGTREFCFGDSFTLADIGCGAALLYLDITLPEQDWRAAHPVLAAHFARLRERDSFKSLG